MARFFLDNGCQIALLVAATKLIFLSDSYRLVPASLIRMLQIHLGGLSSFTRNLALANDGGGIYTVEGCFVKISGSCTFENNEAVNGGAVSVHSNSTLDVAGNVSFVLNNAYSYGGAISAYALATVGIAGHATFDSNTAVLGGGGSAFFESEVRLEGGVSFVNNISPFGGAVHLETSTLIIDSAEVMFSHNNVSELPEYLDIQDAGLGGAIYMYNHSLMRIEAAGSSSFESNGAMWGGAIVLTYNSELHLHGTATFSRNVATLTGGMPHRVCSPVLHECTRQSIRANNRSQPAAVQV